MVSKRRPPDKEKRNAYLAVWREANRDKTRAANSDKHLATRRQRYEKNRGEEIARVRRRQGRMRQGSEHMSLAEQVEVEAMYAFCKVFPGFEVDHIVPLNGENICGPHTPSNLQVLPMTTNRSKGNKVCLDTIQPDPVAIIYC